MVVRLIYLQKFCINLSKKRHLPRIGRDKYVKLTEMQQLFWLLCKNRTYRKQFLTGVQLARAELKTCATSS